MIDVRPQKPLVNASSSAAAIAPSQKIAHTTKSSSASPAARQVVPASSPGIPPATLSPNHLDLVYRQFEQRAAELPAKTAIHFARQRLSYGELNRRANRLARHLVSLGAGPDVLIGVCVARSPELIVTLLAIHKAGSAYLPLDLDYPRDRIQYILGNAQAPLLICNSTANLPNTQAQVIDLQAASLAQYDDSNLESRPNLRDLAYVIYTSGSTGKPKGVQIEHRSLSNLIQSMAEQPGLTAADVALTLTTVAFDMSIPELFLPLSVGATMELVGRDIATDGHRLKQLLGRTNITWIQGTPSTWRMLLAAGWTGNDQLKILIGGEATARELAGQLLQRCKELWNMYGPTETAVWSMSDRILPDERPICLGQPLDNTQVYLMEELANGELYHAGPGQPGEICIGGWGVARGYLHQPLLTREKFVSDFQSPEVGAKLYRTGDLAKELADGSLQFIGRLDHQVKIRGHRVELGEVEAALGKHPQISNAAVIAHRDESQSQQLIGYLVPQNTSLQNIQPSSGIAQATSSNDTASNNIEEQGQAVVEHWKTLWDDAYRLGENASDPTFDFSGYRDTYTGDLLPAEAIEEWTERTVERILALKPRRVLEVGCGKGLILFRAAPQCCRYVGVDVSPAAIAHLQTHLDKNPQRWSHVSLACAAADQLSETLVEQKFDTIVINSVIQYFPNIDYLFQVFEQLMARLQPGGKIFLGDIRNPELLHHFHSTVLQQRQQVGIGDPLQTVGEFNQLLAQQSQQDHELLLAPNFFQHLQARCSRIRRIVTQLKRGHEQNELIDFRYDVVLHLDDEDCSLLSPTWLDWEQQSLAEIETYLTTHQPDSWAVRDITNARLSSSHKLLEQLSSNNPEQSLATLQALAALTPEALTSETIAPEDLWELGQKLSYRTHISWGSAPDCFNVIFQKVTYPGEQQDWAHSSLAQTWLNAPALENCIHSPWQTTPPSQAPEAQSLTARPPLCSQQLRQFLTEHLPAYMVPSQFVVLEQLPLTPNHKVNRQALPQPSPATILRDQTDVIAPTGPIEQQLAQLWQELLQQSPISKTANFFDCGGHSLLATQLITRIQETFDLELSLAVLFQAPILEDLANAIAQAAQTKATQAKQLDLTVTQSAPSLSPLAQQIQADCQLAPDIRLDDRLGPLSHSLNHIFLTGATGLVGGFLLQELLDKTEATIHCLVRSPNRAEAQRKLENHLEQCQIPWAQYRDRILAIPGDLAQPQLGLSDTQWQAFQEQIDAIYHNGAYVNLIYPYGELRAANVDSTTALLRLASLSKLKAMHYISTLDVLHGDSLLSNQQLTEDQPLPPSEGLSSDYARTKWVAEHLILAARQRGIPCNIYRLGMTTGHSRHGYSNANDMIGRLIRGMVAIAAAPTGSFPLNLAPVDSVCQAIVSLSLQQNNRYPTGQTFHTSHPQAISLADIVQQLRAKGYELQSLSYNQWVKRIMADPQANALQPLLANFGNQATAQGTDFFKVLDLSPVTTAHFQAALPTFRWPNVAQGVLEQYIRYFISRGLLTSPQPSMVAGAAQTSH